MKNQTFTILVAAAIAILSSTFVAADVIRVPQDQATIQAGINASVNGDTVLVEDNTYYENINFKSKWITVASHYVVDGDTSHINNTIIDGSRPSHPDSGSVVSFVWGFEDTNSVLTGFTITGGSGTRISNDVYNDKDGGGIFIRNSGAKIVKNKIINNHITAAADTFAGGAAIFASNSMNDLIIRDNIISNNSATTTGDAQSFATVIVNTIKTCFVENNLIQNNVLSTPPSSFAFAAGLMIDGWDRKVGDYIVRNNIIRDNKFEPEDCGSGGGVVIQNCSPLFYNNIVSGNSGKYGGGIWVIHYMSAIAVAPKPRIINNTIINNSAIETGGGILVGSTADSYAYLMNNIIWGNSAKEDVQIGKYGGAGIQARYSIVQGDYGGVGNMDVDPKLVADSLANESPAIGTGTHKFTFGGGIEVHCPAHDINGRERPDPAGADNPDIGAWESKLSSPLTGIDVARVAEIPDHFTLYQNHPNPFNPGTTITYDLARSGKVKLIVFNALGKEVAELVNKNQVEGSHSVSFDAQHLSTGIYWYQLQVNGEISELKKMVLLK